MRAAIAIAAIAVVAVVAAVLLLGRDEQKTCMRQLVPAYFAPGAANGWDALLAATPPDVATVIMNPANGPGPAKDPAYAKIVAAARARELAVVGYVPTRFGTRPVAEVEADVERYREWYGIDGIFMDEASAEAADLPYYRELAALAGGTVILNPGRVPDAGYVEVADIVVTFEGTRAAYAGASFPAWTTEYGAERFAHLVYEAGGAEPGSVERSAAARGAANVYVTDDAGANPWDALPASYAQAAAALAGCGIAVSGG